MANTTLDNISKDVLRWAFLRAGLSEEQAFVIFPLLEDWLNDVKKPTISQLKKYAAKVYAPLGFLYLKEAPVERLPFPMFRGTAGQSNHFDLNVYDTVLEIGRRQDWLEDYLVENDIDTCKFVGTLTQKNSVREVVDKLREMLNLESKWAFDLKDAEAAVNVLTTSLEEAGVFVAYNGIVGNNTRRPIKVSQCRGFALANKIAPYIFVNSSDSKYAQIFTLIHECTHLVLGLSAGHAGDPEPFANAEESFCDKVAAEFLVPRDIFFNIWEKDLKSLSKSFKVSEIVIARRAHDLGLLSDNDYRTFWMEYKNRPKPIKKNFGGGNFYRTCVKRIGRVFAIHVNNAVQNRMLSYTEAYRLTNLYGSTYQKFMTNNILS